jgi:hypothetical protein
MMRKDKQQIYLIIIASLIYSNACNQPGKSTNELELKLKEKELALKERQMVIDSLNNLAAKPKSKTKSSAQPAKNTNSKSIISARHKLSLQWISWENFGYVYFNEIGPDTYSVNGSQEGNPSDCEDCYLRINGTMKIINEKELSFTGTIETSVNHIQNGTPCIRQGTFVFKSTQGRKYWREQGMDGCAGVLNYIDIYF